MESVDELCQDANKFNNYLRNVARQQQQKVAFIHRQVKQNIYIYIYRKVRLMKPTHDSLLLRVSCLRTHQTVFNKENSYHLVYIQACEKLLLFA